MGRWPRASPAAAFACSITELGGEASVTLEKRSPCKVNLLLNILGRRADGFHSLETVMHPVLWHDELEFSRSGNGVELTCDDPALPTDSGPTNKCDCASSSASAARCNRSEAHLWPINSMSQ